MNVSRYGNVDATRFAGATRQVQTHLAFTSPLQFQGKAKQAEPEHPQAKGMLSRRHALRLGSAALATLATTGCTLTLGEPGRGPEITIPEVIIRPAPDDDYYDPHPRYPRRRIPEPQCYVLEPGYWDWICNRWGQCRRVWIDPIIRCWP